jgi:hypothetical protein
VTSINHAVFLSLLLLPPPLRSKYHPQPPVTSSPSKVQISSSALHSETSSYRNCDKVLHTCKICHNYSSVYFNLCVYTPTFIEICPLLGYYAASSGNPLPTVRVHVSIPRHVVPKRRYIITTRRCVISQKSADLINIVAKAWNNLLSLFVITINITSSLQQRWRSWLRHCATSRKVAGSIPDGVIGIFH